MSTIKRLDSFAKGNIGTYDAMGQGAIDMLESITAADMGQAVPYVEIWQINPSTGLPLHGKGGRPSYPLTAWTVAPPVFGASADEFAELRERPDVSLEGITIKTVNPKGLILYRQLTINFTVHRPDALAASPDKDRDNWSAMITPGSIFAMEYGWSANEGQVKNSILNGTDTQGTSDEGRKWIVHGHKIIRFAVTNYKFVILPDQQIQITVSAIEDGDYGMRHTYVVPGVRPTRSPADSAAIIAYSQQKFKTEFNANAKKIQKEIKEKLTKVAKKNKSAHKVVRLEDVFNIFFADKIEETLFDMGYSDVTFTIGCTNLKCPTPIEKHKQIKDGDSPNNYIGDYTVPLAEVIDRMSDMIAVGTSLTVFNFMTPFLRMLSDPLTWKNEQDKDVTMPDIQLRFDSIMNNDGTQDAHIFVIDVKTELMRFTDEDATSYKQWAKEHSRSVSNVANRDEIRKICKAKGVPYVEFMKGNGWIKDAQFDVVADELMQSIFINRYYGKDRNDATTKSTSEIRDQTPDHRMTLYSSAIKGQLTCIGNHGMDVMGMYWMDFGVPAWSGPFRLVDRVDQIDSSGWWTTIRFISEGNDPLGTQNRPKIEKNKLAPPQKQAARATKKNIPQGVVKTSRVVKNAMGLYYVEDGKGSNIAGPFSERAEAEQYSMRLRS